jgi:Uma2 family endonuclease
MSAAATDRRMTAEDLPRLPRGRERHERIEGELKTTSPKGAQLVVAADLPRRLRNHVHEQRLGRVFSSEGGFVIRRRPDAVIAPDAAFVTAERMAVHGIPSGYREGPPDLAVEVVSPHDRMADVDDNIDAWLNAGTRLVWVIHPRRRIAMIHRPHQPVPLVRADDFLDRQEVVPGFPCRLDEVLVT